MFLFILYLFPILAGVIGDSNAPCFNDTSTAGGATFGAVGTSCTLSSDCLYNICNDQKCGVALLTCPTNLYGERYSDILFDKLFM
jgi:hypothetical protein